MSSRFLLWRNLYTRNRNHHDQVSRYQHNSRLDLKDKKDIQIAVIKRR